MVSRSVAEPASLRTSRSSAMPDSTASASAAAAAHTMGRQSGVGRLPPPAGTVVSGTIPASTSPLEPVTEPGRPGCSQAISAITTCSMRLRRSMDGRAGSASKASPPTIIRSSARSARAEAEVARKSSTSLASAAVSVLNAAAPRSSS